MDVLIIFSLQVVYVTINTVRLILLLRGNRYPAAAISVVEVMLWVYALGLVVSQLDDVVRLLAYALGFGTGLIVGSLLEEKLAMGYTTVQVVAQAPSRLPELFRGAGFGVTSWHGQGRDGRREVLLVVARRRRAGELFRLLEEHEPKAFALLMEPRSFRGGFLAGRVPVAPVGPMPPSVLPPEEAGGSTD